MRVVIDIEFEVDGEATEAAIKVAVERAICDGFTGVVEVSDDCVLLINSIEAEAQ
jgi:hypothetical protein